MKEDKLTVFVSNAGLVLLWPYLSRLFELLLLTEAGKFKNDEARIKAIFVMQYAVFGQTEFAEHELELNKLLTGIKADVAIPFSVELTPDEKDVIERLLMAVIMNWSSMANSSINNLRYNFLIRKGKLEESEGFYELIVEEKGFDVLLNSLPWNFGVIKLGWMEKSINVKWI